MFDIWASIAQLQQPCLYRPIGDRLLGPDGLVRRQILTSLDNLFREHLAAGRANFQAPASPPPIPAVERFLNISALQKSIRRGDVEGAMRFAQQGCSLDAEQVFRRLAVCAVEDVGIGNLLAVGMALAAMGNRTMRQNGATEELAAYLAYLLAISPKSRLACDLLSIVDYDRALDPLKRRLARATDADLRTMAENKVKLISHRMLAAWLLAGTARFRGVAMPRVSRSRSEVMRMMAVSRMPLVLYYIADRTAARTGDALFVSMFLIAEMTDADVEISVTEDHEIAADEIYGYPAAAFDLHTHEGRTALARFARSDAMRSWLADITPSARDTLVRHAVFIAEGGRLNERLTFEVSEVIRDQAHSVELSFGGLISDRQPALMSKVAQSLPILHELRIASR